MNPAASVRKEIKKTLQNEELIASFRQGTAGHVLRRKKQIENFVNFESLREEASAVRKYAIDHLPELLEKLEENCLRNGIHVLWAKNSESLCQNVAEILENHNCKSVLKGKSMVSEEVHLNAYLEKLGVECIETDLGEYILQLGGETPSHIIAPAIHKNMHQIKSILLGEEYIRGKIDMSEQELTEHVRKIMRVKYQQADAGISGVNFAFADNGAFCLVENEGNGRYTTTVPRVHIALMTIEKVNAHFSDLPTLLKVLTISACGQASTTYTNVITGPKKTKELDGPEHVYLILLDNGRSKMLEQPDLKKALWCVRCGACMNHCPIYNTIGGHSYNAVIPGPIGQILMPQLEGLDRHGEILNASTLCGKCSEVCPVKIPISDIILQLRHEAVRKDKTSDEREHQKLESPALKGTGKQRKAWEAFTWKVWALIFASPFLQKTLRSALSLQPRFLFGHIPGIKNWTKSRTFPKISGKSVRAEIARMENERNGK